MKTAIIYTGAMRSFDKCWKNHQWMIWRHFPGAKFYCVTEQDDDAEKTKLIPTPMNGKILKQPTMVIPPGCPDTWTQGQPYMHEPYSISVHPHAVLGQLWMMREGWRLYEEAGEPADLVIRIRPDLWFHSFEVPFWFVRPNGRELDKDGFANVPWWGRFGGCNDRFALLDAKGAEHYFKTYDKIPRLISEGAPLHPETLVHASLREGGISICDDMKAEFSTLRKSGEMRHPEITMIDLAHFKS